MFWVAKFTINSLAAAAAVVVAVSVVVAVAAEVDVAVAGDKYNFTHEPLVHGPLFWDSGGSSMGHEPLFPL